MECGQCTQCCVDLELTEIPSKIGERCRHCTIGKGCNIYNERPQECRSFQCMYSQMEYAPIELRPDHCGVIFSRKGNDVIAGRIGHDSYMSDLALKQIYDFNKQGFSVILYRGAEYKLFLLDTHSKEYVLGIENGSS